MVIYYNEDFPERTTYSNDKGEIKLMPKFRLEDCNGSCRSKLSGVKCFFFGDCDRTYNDKIYPCVRDKAYIPV